MKDDYQTFVQLGNEGAKELGFRDVGDVWKSRYDMPTDALEADIERLWSEVKPLYEQLHCYARGKLAAKWKGKMKNAGKMPAHVFGNMWSQTWGGIYEQVEPFPGQPSIDVTKALARKKITPKKMVEISENFFVSLGMPKLPETFWKRSMIVKPRDREVVCHASAWDLTFAGDVRIKMCTQVNEEDLVTLHHELGHVYYYLAYNQLPILFQDGANDGFHEAIGDTIALSITPGYLVDIGVLDKAAAKSNPKADMNLLMRRALDKVAFLPFGLLIDKWRWDVFAGKTPPDKYNQAWWDLVGTYQGIEAPAPRGEEHFDPGAKYHVPANTPYLRYFLAAIYQFQFHRALCKAAGHQGPLHTCSIYGNKAAGEKMWAMLQMGASKPWPEAMKAITGESKADATALLEYFKPLQDWLIEQNKGQQCGW
jgi:peptidyl-dipeptidase A